MERKRERQTLLLAILASVLLHFAVAISLASFGDKLQPSLPDDEEKPSELTLVDLASAPPVVNKNAQFIDTPENRQTKEEPKEKTFESNANSIGASELPALGDAPVPTQDGKDRPNLDLENQEHALALQGSQPQPEARQSLTPPPLTPTPTPAPSASATTTPQPTTTPTPPPTATPTPELEPTRSPEPDQLAMLRATPPPPSAPAEETMTPQIAIPPPSARPTPSLPRQPSSTYRREQSKTRLQGNISNRGIASVNALGTPLGRYQKLVGDAIGSRWYGLVDQNRDRVNIGTVHVEFVVDRSGHITKLRILENSADESFSNLCLESVQDARLPPIPDELAATLPSDGLPADMRFTIYPNQ
jgi:TonB family protein